MADGPELPPWARPRPPEGRPTWVVVLALAMLIFGGRLLINGVAQLGGPPVDRALEETASAQVGRDLKVLGESLARAYREHPTAVRANGASKVVMGLLLLFAVAAVFVSDPRARAATLVAAWAGIAYQVGDALFLFLIFRKGLVEVAPALVDLAARQTAAGQAPSAGTLISMMDVVIVGLGLVGIGFSVVLLAFFGGRRGRTFFGVDAGARSA
jgi:hypothetical protein